MSLETFLSIPQPVKTNAHFPASSAVDRPDFAFYIMAMLLSLASDYSFHDRGQELETKRARLRTG